MTKKGKGRKIARELMLDKIEPTDPKVGTYLSNAYAAFQKTTSRVLGIKIWHRMNIVKKEADLAEVRRERGN